MWQTLKKLLLVIPAMFVLGFANTLICFSCAGLVELQLVLWGFGKTVSFGISAVVALGVWAFVAFNHKIRDYIEKKRQE